MRLRAPRGPSAEPVRRPASRRRSFPFLDAARACMTAEPLRVLLVEDEPGHAELARRAFEGQAGAFDVSVAETVGAAREALHGETPPDLVIADWLLPDGEGLDLLRSEPAARHAAGRDHDQPRQRARRGRGDPRRRGGLRRQERDGARRPAAHGRARRAPPADRAGARRPGGGHRHLRGRGALRRARAAARARAAGEVRLGRRARGARPACGRWRARWTAG